MVTRAAIHYTHEHWVVTARRDALLCSINDRLGVLVGDLWPRRYAGEEFPPLDIHAYLDEMVHFAAMDAPKDDDDGDDKDDPQMVD